MLVGTPAELAPFLAPAWAALVRASTLAVLPLDAQSRRFVVVATGATRADVDRALRALNALTFALPDTARMTVEQLDEPVLADYAGQRMLYPRQRRRFGELGLHTQTFQGRFGKDELSFVLPPDLYVPGNDSVELKLNFAYGAGLREDSVLNIMLNDRFQAAIRLDSAAGGYYEGYNITVPMASFLPGANTIRFESAMMPLISGKCQDINTQNLQFTLFEESTVQLPDAAHVASLPDLNLLARTGFPHTLAPRGGATTVLVAEADSATAAAAWTLIGRLSQIQKLPLDELAFAVGTEPLPAQRDVLIVGAADQIAPAVLAHAPLQLAEHARAAYPSLASPTPATDADGVLGWWRGLARAVSAQAQAQTPPPVTWMTEAGHVLGSRAALMQFESPAAPGHTLTVLAAATPATLLTQTRWLIDPAVWSGLSGDLVVWSGSSDLASQRVGPEYTHGGAGWWLHTSYLLSRHPWLWAIAMAVLIVGLSVLSLRLLTRFRHRRHPGVGEDVAAGDAH